jgi:SAM-dependent methyltransferase/ADP-ribose pyrophosphatase YjhB (NUDIX family)
MPEILSLALFERSRRVLVARRKVDRPPFADEWLLPGAIVASDDAAEEALAGHLHRELGIEAEDVDFVETLYLEDEATGRRCVANVFRVPKTPGELRFRAAGDYDDVRWLTDDELADVAMPAALRDWLLGARLPAQSVRPQPLPAIAEPPDNRAAWNTISRPYQDRYQLPTDRLVWGPRVPDESELQLLGDVSGKRVIVLGCGGGQDCIVLAKAGAQVTGVDLSDKQIEYGRRLAEREGVLVTLVQGNAEELHGIEDESYELAVSVHALNYVEHVDRAFAEAHRVLKPGSAFVFSVHHPFDATLEDQPPYGVAKSYWQPALDWQWDFPEAKASARMRSWYRTVSEWFALVTDAGFRVERVLEPRPVADTREPWRTLGSTPNKAELIPDTLILKAVKP